MICNIRYTNDVWGGFAGATKACFIRIKPEYRDDVGLLMHEKVHVAQFWRTFGFHSLLYLISKKYRLNAEIEAYKAQLTLPPATSNPDYYRSLYAKFIANKYHLNITKEEVLKKMGEV